MMPFLEVFSLPGKHSFSHRNRVNLNTNVSEDSSGKTCLTSSVDQEGLKFQKEKKGFLSNLKLC